MAIFRKVHTSFWSDSFIIEQDKDKTLFYLYLLTNERTKQCGVYEISKKQIAFDLGYNIDTVSKLLQYFILKGKIKYNEATSEIGIGNWLKYNSSTSPKVVSCINKEFALVKDTLLIEYVKSMDTHPQEEEEEEEEQTQEESVSFDAFWNLYNKKIGSKDKCIEKWKKIKNVDKEKIIETLPTFIARIKDKQYQPNPETYLNAKRWNDELEAPKKTNEYKPFLDPATNKW